MPTCYLLIASATKFNFVLVLILYISFRYLPRLAWLRALVHYFILALSFFFFFALTLQSLSLPLSLSLGLLPSLSRCSLASSFLWLWASEAYIEKKSSATVGFQREHDSRRVRVHVTVDSYPLSCHLALSGNVSIYRFLFLNQKTQRLTTSCLLNNKAGISEQQEVSTLLWGGKGVSSAVCIDLALGILLLK